MAHHHNYSVFKNFCVQFNVSSQDMLQLHMYTHMHVRCRQVIAWEIIPERVRRDVLLLSHYKQR